eukprot:m.175263 g.175263  ORF g.175263 m.175263 type:complete len:761 (+) comp13962_c0_seq1:1772-4054(+)
MSNFHEVSDQNDLRKLREHTVSLSRLGTVVSDFMKRKALLQERYAAELRALADSMEQRSDPATALRGLDGYEHHNLVNLWGHCRKATVEEAVLFEANAADHKETSAKLAETLMVQKKFFKMAFQDCADLSAGVKQLETECEKCRQANVHAHAEPAPAAGGIMGQVFTSLSKMKDKAVRPADAVSPGPQAHNNYLLQLVACNVQRRKYFDADLPEMLDAAQHVYTNMVDQTSTAVNHFAVTYQNSAKALSDLQERIIARSGPVTTGRVAVATVVDVISPSNTTVQEVKYVGPDGKQQDPSSVSFDVNDRAAMQSLARKRAGLEITMKGHAAELAKRTKHVTGIEKLYENYQKNPQFGSADAVYVELYENRRKVRNLETLVQRNQAVITALAQSGVEAVSGPQGVPSPDGSILRLPTEPRAGGGRQNFSMYSEEPDWDEEGEGDRDSVLDSVLAASNRHSSNRLSRVFTAPEGSTVVARYEYTPENEDELAFEVGDVIEVTSPIDGNGWMGGKLGDRHGIFPAAYCTAFQGNWEDLGITLYDYAATKSDELSVRADEVLVVESTTDDGWAEARREDTGETGLIPLSYLQRGFAKDPATASARQQTESSKSSVVADALAGAFDDLDLSSSDDEPLPDVADEGSGGGGRGRGGRGGGGKSDGEYINVGGASTESSPRSSIVGSASASASASGGGTGVGSSPLRASQAVSDFVPPPPAASKSTLSDGGGQGDSVPPSPPPQHAKPPSVSPEGGGTESTNVVKDAS